ncbi:hypothetical protein B4U79_17674, partial [Dinothrombium tinctorium]
MKEECTFCILKLKKVSLWSQSFVFNNLHLDDNTSVDDIFIIDVIEKPPLTANKHNGQQKDCIIQITPAFTGVKNVWKVIYYLMPMSLRQKIDSEVLFKQNQESYDADDSNLIQQWITSLFNIQIFNEQFSDVRSYKITIENQDCDDASEKIFINNLEYKLKKLRLDYNKVKVVKPMQRCENDDLDTQFFSTKIWSQKPQCEDSLRKKARRHIQATPALNPIWTTLSVSMLHSVLGEIHSNTEDTVMTRVVQTLKSPTIATPNPSYEFHSEISNQFFHIRHPHQKFHAIYSTPILSPEPPTERFDETLTPTPVFTVITTPDFELISETKEFILPTPSLSFELSSSAFSDIVSSSEFPLSSSFSPDLFSKEAESILVSSTPLTTPKIVISTYPNKGPSIYKRIPKLSLTAGKYWRYYIPHETFFDSEDGNTRSLKLTFLIFDLDSDREDSPPPDYWIQFDHENQYLFALPTEKNIGKHKFTLVAVDSKGEPVTELLEVHVRQHPSSRAFHHIFTLYNVVWDNYKYPLLIEAVSKLARKVVRIFGDHNLNSFTVQSIENVDNTFTISWTNSSLPAYPCPKETIHNLYGKLADLTKISEGISANPSRLLTKATSPEFQISGVGLRLLSSCSGSPPT